MLDFRPLEGRNKIVIVDPAALMNAAAANALLKALEEPPENSYIILITDKLHALLSTIRSRCQPYAFTPLSTEDLRNFGSRDGATDELTLRWSRGSIGRYQTLDTAALKSHREFILDFLETALQSTPDAFRELLSVAKEVGGTKQDFGAHLEMIGVVITDLIYLSVGRAEHIVNFDIRSRLDKLVGNVRTETLIRLSELLGEMEKSLKSNVNRPMLTEVLALSMNRPLEKILDDIPNRSR